MFQSIVRDQAALRAILGEPNAIVKRKVLPRIDDHARAFIARSPFALIATHGAAGCDVSPRGDVAGFAAILDDATIALPERPGNRRADTLLNILDDPQVGLLFLVPGMDETLRLNGTAQIVQDADLLGRFAVHGKTPLLAIAVTVSEAFFHCAKAFRRSKLWDPAGRIVRSELPSLARIITEQQGIVCDLAEYEAAVEAGYQRTLY